MGTYIGGCAERKTDSGWEVVEIHLPWLLDYQCYEYFGWLGGVRNYAAVSSVAERRGLPADVSKEAEVEYDHCYDASSPSYVTVEELLAIDYQQLVENRRTHEVVGNIGYGNRTCEPGKGETMTLEEYLGSERVAEIRSLPSKGIDRLVFWFS